MKRRAFLGFAGSAVSLGTLAYATRRPTETLSVRVWLSEQAATYEGVSDRILEYLGEMLDLEYWSLETSVGGTVSVSTEDAATLTSRGEWPMAVAEGMLGRRDLEPAADVNLLVTDGGMEDAPTGYGIPHVASVGGARNIAALDSYDELVSDREVPIVPNEKPTRTIQVLVHEVGHALGLNHDHGVAFVRDGAVVATPMLSSYAWDPGYDGEGSRCGTAIPDAAGREQRLSLSFSLCARRELATYDGGVS
ncbi:peptidase M10A and M12B matrixin and adamalysin [Natrinema caseinilyticum]|uniref:peptidase M10A and M12B matrixin and adamalysin n=1 Tax=Natrinema caseinilyticum TaxID=2961570 RepID=UPI0020C2F9CB|nr:peptidase M10A and M12B matrixin and adamalysin [Natrinema caseinilyticum]